MKHLLLLALSLPLVGSAQITLNSSDFSNANDTVRMSTTTDFAIDFATTGANHSWDFTNLVAESQTLFDFQDVSSASALSQFLFGGFAPTQYQASYFIASDDLPLDQLGTFLPVSITDVYQFSRVTADSIASVGFSMLVEGNEIPFRSDTIEKRYQFPLNYQDTYTGKGYTEMDLNPIANIIWKQARQRSSEVDGWGSIDLPIGSFDVLRVRHTIFENDSIYQEFFGNPMWVGIDLPTAYIYEWIAAGEKEPVLRIETSEVGGSEVVRKVEYRDNYDPLLAGIEENTLVALEVYPNPANNEILVNQPIEGANFVIIDGSGRTVLSGVLSDKAIHIESLESGAYLMIVSSEQGWTKASFVKN